MKRFLIALFICSAPFSAKATLLGDFYELFEKDTEVMENALQEKEEPRVLFYDGNRLVRIDSKLREFVDPNDFDYMKENGEGFYKAPADGNTLGYYSPSKNIIALIDKVLSCEKVDVQETIHHEVQHQKDYMTLKKEKVYIIKKDYISRI